MGEVLKDFYRLASYPGAVDRVFVYLETSHLREYMAGVTRRYRLNLDADNVILRPTEVAALPKTATDIIGASLAAHTVAAARLLLLPIDDDLRLAVYHVDPLAPPVVADDAAPIAATREGD